MSFPVNLDGGLALFLVGAAMISLSGVMMPGPVLAVTISKGRDSPLAGTWVAIGHGLIEIPLMFLIYTGVATFLSSQTAQTAIGIVGGIVLVWMGFGMLRSPSDETGRARSAAGPLASGLVTTASNPYFFLWWVTAGSLLISRSVGYGLSGFLCLALVHWLCDLSWYALVSVLTYRSRRLWSPLVHRVIFCLCGLVLIGFGLYFAASVLT